MLAQTHTDAATPTGATLVPGGATFRVWAPRASAVYLNGSFGGVTYDKQIDDRLLANNGTGYWTRFQAGAADGDTYRYWVVGAGGSGYKRDPYARELSPTGFPSCFSILHAVDAYPWHDAGFRTPDFSDMVIYQLHIGTYAISRPGIASNFLDVAGKVPYLAALGVNVLQPLPIDEQEANPGMGYGGADLFSPDFPYVAAAADLPAYLAMINGVLAGKTLAPLTLADIASGPGQLKALVDLCHVHDIAVTFDVVYNHAGGFSVAGQLDDNCIYYFDRAKDVGDNNDSLYFTNQDRGTGGLAFALWNQDVCRFLQDNAAHYITEYHADGFRYDEISILLSTGQATGWAFCRALTSELRGLQPRLLQNAEFWPGEFNDIPTSAGPIVTPAAAGGAGFDVVQHDALRNALRGAVGAASAGAGAAVSMSSIAGALYPPGSDHGWRAVTCIENHDLVMAGRNPRIPTLADDPDPRFMGRAQPDTRRHHDPSDRAGHPAALHGTGISRGTTMGHQPGRPESYRMGRASRRCRPRHGRSSPLYAGTGPSPLGCAGAPRRQRPRLLRLRYRPRARVPSLDRRCGRRCDCGCNFRRGHLVELHARLPRCWPMEGSVQQ